MKKGALIFIIIILILLALYIISLFGALLQSWVMNHTAQNYLKHPNPMYLLLRSQVNSTPEENFFCYTTNKDTFLLDYKPHLTFLKVQGITAQEQEKADKYAKTDCLAALKFKGLFCSSIAKEDRKQCYERVAGFHGDISYCNKYGCESNFVYEAAKKNPEVCEDPLVNDYRYQCYYNAVKGDQSSEYCDRIEDQQYKDHCYYNYALYHGEHEICEDIETIEFKDKCLVNRAINTDDDNICRYRVTDQKWKDSCLYHIVKATNNFEICDELVTTTNINSCFYEKAKQLQDVESCRKISSDHSRHSCLSLLASTDSNISYCDEITKESYKDNCIKKYATENNDLEACDKITSEYKKEECQGESTPSIEVITPE